MIGGTGANLLLPITPSPSSERWQRCVNTLTAAEALGRQVPAEVLDLVALGRQERGAGFRVDGVDRLQGNPHLVVRAVQPACIEDAPPGLAVLFFGGEESDHLRQCPVPRVEREARGDGCPGTEWTAPGDLLVGRRWCDRGEEGTLANGDRLIERPRLASWPGQDCAAEEDDQREPESREQVWPDELLDGAGE